MSGYIDVGTNKSMVSLSLTLSLPLLTNVSQWFWFFEARENSETAPFTLW